MAAIRQGSPEWLEARRHTIGSSDVPIIVGESSYRSLYSLAAEKLGLAEEEIDDETQELMDIGTLLQPALLRIYERKTGRRAHGSSGWLRHPQFSWATASLDGRAPVRRVVEAKWSNAVKWRSGEKVPGDVFAQVQWQLFVTGWEVADVVALEHGRPRVEEVARDEEAIENIFWMASRFHDQLERGELPPMDATDSSRRTWTRLHPNDDGTLLAPTPELAELTRRLAAARAAKAEADAADKSLGNAIRAIVGDATGVEGLLTLRSSTVTRKNWPAIAHAYRELLQTQSEDTLDAIESVHSEAAQVRTLRLLEGATS